MAEKEYKEIDITSLDSELAAAKAVEDGRKDKFIKIATIVAIAMTVFHIYTGFFGLFDFVTQRGVHLSFALTSKSILPAMAKSAFSSMSIVIGCACAGFVVGMVSLTGIGVIFGDMMIQAAHGLLFPSLLFTAIACVILGMGLPTTAAYVIAASILAPSLIKLGLPALTAHLFVFYFACLSAITPPVALAAYAGAGIAKTSPMTTAIEACKLGFAGFMVPFAFCYNEAMMMQGNVVDIISVAVSAIVGTAVISAAFQGWLLWKLNILERTAFIVGGLLMFIPGTVTDLIGLAIALLLILINMRKWKKIKQSV